MEPNFLNIAIHVIAGEVALGCGLSVMAMMSSWRTSWMSPPVNDLTRNANFPAVVAELGEVIN